MEETTTKQAFKFNLRSRAGKVVTRAIAAVRNVEVWPSGESEEEYPKASECSVVKAALLQEAWVTVRAEAEKEVQAQAEAKGEVVAITGPLLSHFLKESVFKWNSLEEALAAHLAKKLSTECALIERWRKLIYKALHEGGSQGGEPISTMMLADLYVTKRDPACPGLAHSLLYFKGFHAIQLYRVANWLWREQQRCMAFMIQSRVSEIFGMDIHPACNIGKGVFFDHGTGIVIGETAVVGDGCTLLHGVTLGGTGKDSGDRHPKLGEKVLVGAGASILGNVKIGEGAKIGAAALVLTDIPSHATAVGCPAKVVGRSKEDNPAQNLDAKCQFVDFFKNQKTNYFCPFRHLDLHNRGFLNPFDFSARLNSCLNGQISESDAKALFFELDSDCDGQLTEKEFEEGYEKFSAAVKRVLRLESQEEVAGNA